jgi:UDPglucose 6-dehydrogenase
MRVGVVGTGHVGLITCVSLAKVGHEVVGADSEAEKISDLQRGETPFYEPGLKDLLHGGLESGRLSFSRDTGPAVAGAEVVFVCVGTPARASGEASLVAVEAAAGDVARSATGPAVVVEKSTVPAGTAQRLKRALRRERPDLDGRLEVVSNPEFLREGRAIQDALHPERILIGAESEHAFEVMRKLYGPFVDEGHPIIETDIQTAELSKHACNAFLALKISYANALARICERAGADVVAVADVMGSDPRIGHAFLNAGLGYGGYCFPKDIQAFQRLAGKLGYDFPLLAEVARINEEAVTAVAEKVREALWNLEDKRIALLGLSFKAGTDDVRFSPALALARLLLDEGATVVGYDPEAAANAKTEVPEIELAPDPYDAAGGAHCAVICTEWDEFRELDLGRLKDQLAYSIVVDGRNLFDPAAMEAAGLSYHPTGRPAVEP